jgi:transposase-like protein
LKLLIIYIDGVVFGEHTMIGAVGVDAEGRKHVLGIREGATENATVVMELLQEIVARGVDAKQKRLFVIDGSKALRAAINAVFGADQPVQRCRAHKLRNVLDHLPEEQKEQVKSLMRAAWKMDAKAGISRIRKLAEWLEREYPSAAASLREGLEECFTINRLGLPPTLQRCNAAWRQPTFSKARTPECASEPAASQTGKMARWSGAGWPRPSCEPKRASAGSWATANSGRWRRF